MEIDSYQTELTDYIVELENVLSPENCKEIIEEYENSKSWRSGSVGAKREVDKNTRNCEVLPISISEVINENTERRKELDSKIFEAVSKCLKYYNGMFWNLQVQKDTGYNLLRYGEGGFYVEHIDHFPEVQRTLTMSLILNDDYEGGEFSFFNKEYLIKPQAGQAIIFPSNFMFPHGVMPVKGGKRYAVVTWFL
jgi:predicted 2-oxoglutarate/Fe(II)-dependent dioxygenase YbiX